MQRLIGIAAAVVVAFAAKSAHGTLPPAYWKHLPPEQTAGAVSYITGGRTPEEAESIKRAAQEYPLELVFEEKGGAHPKLLYDMPVTVTDMKGRVVFEGKSTGPYFIARLPKGRYVVTTKWQDWTFSRTVTVDDADRERVVFSWKAPSASATG